MRSLAFGHAVPSPMHIRSVIKQPLLHAIYFKPSVLQACLGKRHVNFETTVLFRTYVSICFESLLCSYMEKSQCDS